MIKNDEIQCLYKKKNIYKTKDNKHVIKIFDMKDKKKADNEYNIHSKAYGLVPCPKIIDYYTENDQIIFIMELLEGKNLYEIYGDNPKNIPTKIWKEIRTIISTLYYHDIHYLDITSYNFILVKDKVYIIDFGDAKEVNVNWFLKDFNDGLCEWNPDFF
jgi:tRNA A-37 threonylcarbamoyl transferase component Bud32